MSKTIDSFIRSLFFHYGKTVYQHRHLVIVLSLLIATLLSSGIVLMGKRLKTDPYYLFSPVNGLSHYEKKVLSEHFPLKNNSFLPGKSFDVKHWTDVVTVAKDGGNILREEYLKELETINFYILHELSVNFYDRGKKKYFTVSYQELCLRYKLSCYDNSHIQFLMDHSKWTNMSGLAGVFAADILRKEVVVTYPTGRKGGGLLPLSTLVGGVEVFDQEGHFNFARGIRLTYNVISGGKTLDDISHKWKLALQDYLVSGPNPPSEILDFGLFSADTIYQGLHGISMKFLPDFIVSIVLLTTFACCCSTALMCKEEKGPKSIDWVKSKPLLSLAGVFTAGMGIGSSYGFLLYCGMDFSDIVLVMPFLVIAIGIDDMFIMTSAWHRTNPKDSMENRLANTLAEAAVSITITSVTDFLCFASGCITVMPIIWTFCSYTAAGILFTYFYHLTFFSGILAIIGDMEKDGIHCLFLTKVLDASSGNLHHVDVEKSLVSKFFRTFYGVVLLKPASKAIISMVYLVYLTFAIWGCLRIEEGIETKKLVDPNFYFAKYCTYMEETFWHMGEQAHIVISNPPNLTVTEHRTKLLSMVDEFAKLEETMDENATIFWLKEYKNQMEFYGLSVDQIPTEDFYSEIRNWLLYAAAKENWNTDIQWASEDFQSPDYNKMLAFRFQIGLRSFASPLEQKRTTTKLRQIAKQFAEYNVTTYHPFYPFADWYMIILPTTLRNLGIALACVITVTLLLIPNLLCALLIAAAIISIDLGVIGYMSWAGIHLDSVSMITLIMSTGFAVDFSAHITYAYLQAEGKSNGRAIRALETLGWPVFQGGLSTILGTVVLISIKSYIISTFLCTVFLVILFGFAHSLAFLPVVLTVLLSEDCSSCRRKQVHSGKDKEHDYQSGDVQV